MRIVNAKTEHMHKTRCNFVAAPKADDNSIAAKEHRVEPARSNLFILHPLWQPWDTTLAATVVAASNYAAITAEKHRMSFTSGSIHISQTFKQIRDVELPTIIFPFAGGCPVTVKKDRPLAAGHDFGNEVLTIFATNGCIIIAAVKALKSRARENDLAVTAKECCMGNTTCDLNECDTFWQRRNRALTSIRDRHLYFPPSHNKRVQTTKETLTLLLIVTMCVYDDAGPLLFEPKATALPSSRSRTV